MTEPTIALAALLGSALVAWVIARWMGWVDWRRMAKPKGIDS